MEHYAADERGGVMGHYDSCYEYDEEQKKLETEMKKQEPKKPTMMVIDPSETYPLYLCIVEMARGMVTNDLDVSCLTSEERLFSALIAVAYQYGKDAK